MKIRFISAGVALGIICIIPLLGFSLEEEAPLHAATAAACVSCHEDGQQRWTLSQYQPCTPYCIACHKKPEMERHHTVGTLLEGIPANVLHLSSDKKVACNTCHDMSRTRYDSERWKAASLYDRMFHKETRYKTYFLVMRNDKGQLCLTCH